MRSLRGERSTGGWRLVEIISVGLMQCPSLSTSISLAISFSLQFRQISLSFMSLVEDEGAFARKFMGAERCMHPPVHKIYLLLLLAYLSISLAFFLGTSTAIPFSLPAARSRHLRGTTRQPEDFWQVIFLMKNSRR